MRAWVAVLVGLAAVAAGPVSAQTSGGQGGNGGSIKCIGCVVYGDMIAGNGGGGGNANDSRGGRQPRAGADRQTNVGPGSKCITYNGRPYCD